MPPKQWHTKSGTIKTECPKCHDAGKVSPDCEVCGGSNEIGMGEAIKWILAHMDTEPPPPEEPGSGNG